MRFRPCIDLHNGVVKQIVGSTLSENPDTLQTNFAATKSSKEFAEMYRKDGLIGGHVIMLGPNNDEAALAALAAYPSGLQVGGGVKPSTAKRWIDAGASHVIVTSYIFNEGCLDFDRLRDLVGAAGGRDKVVLDLSCRRKPSDPTGPYYVVMDKWQRFTDTAVTQATLDTLAEYCAEFLVHGVDVEGKGCGIEESLVTCLGMWSTVPVTYAGGCRNLDDIARVERLGAGRVDVTIGSALDIFGGQLAYTDVVAWDQAQAVQTQTFAAPPTVVFKLLPSNAGTSYQSGQDCSLEGHVGDDGEISAVSGIGLQKELADFPADTGDLRLLAVRLEGLPAVELLRGNEALPPRKESGFSALLQSDGRCRITLPKAASPAVPAAAVLAVEVLQRNSAAVEGAAKWHLPPYVTGSTDFVQCSEAAAKRQRT